MPFENANNFGRMKVLLGILEYNSYEKYLTIALYVIKNIQDKMFLSSLKKW